MWAQSSVRSLMSVVSVPVSIALGCVGLADPALTTAPTSKEPLTAEIYDPDHAEADCSYHGVYCDPAGDVYFSLSAHSIAVWARVYKLDAATGEFALLWTPQNTTPETGHVIQGKLHSPIGEYKGELILGTHSGHYKTSHKLPGSDTTVKPYKGGYVYAVDKASGKGRVVAAPLHNRPSVVPMGEERVPIGGEALISSALDAKRGLFYAVSWPSAIFVKVDLKTGESREYGKVQGGAETVPRYLPDESGALDKKGRPKKHENPRFQRCLRTLGMDHRGNVYGSSGDGRIWRYDLKRDRIVDMKSRMEDATAATDLAERPSSLNMWRTIVWDDKDKVFYGVHWASSWLFRFDPRKDKIAPVTRWGAEDLRVVDYAQIGLAMGPNHVLYGFVHAPAIKKGVQRSVHLLTLDVDAMRFKDHGYVIGENGMTLMFAESCAVAGNGDVYTTGWMEIPEERMDEVVRRRKDGGVPEVRYMFVMSLARIRADQIILGR